MQLRRTLTLSAVLAVMIWLGSTSDSWRGAYDLVNRKQDYYNLLVDGFLQGQLNMKIDPHPDLLSLDPVVRSRAPYLLDASLYNGKYYLYFGVVPALFLFLPYAALTGYDLPQNGALVVLVFGGFLLQFRVYMLAQRQYFPTITVWAETLVVCVLAFCASTLVLIRTAGMYEIAIAGGYFCTSLCWLALYKSLHESGRSLRWIVIASFAGGLAVGCRPPLAALLPFVAFAAIGTGWRCRDAGRWIRLAGAAIIPAGVVGLLLMAYNAARFDNPFEFGFNYALAALIFDKFPLASPSFLLPNLRWYYLLPPALSPHFPFVEPLEASVRPDRYYGYEAIYGQAVVLWLAIAGGGGALLWARFGRRIPPLFKGFLALLAGGFLCLLLMLTAFGFRADRYMADFQGTLALLTALAGAWGLSQTLGSRWFGLWRAGWNLLCIAAVLFNLLLPLDHMHLFRNTRPNTYRAMAYLGNYPAHLAAKLGWFTYGPVRLAIELAAIPDFITVPLLATGNSRETDAWYVTSLGDGSFEFSLVHHGYGTPAKERVFLDPNAEHILEVEMGSLLPPRWHPFFRDWPAPVVERAKMTARLSVDGEPLINSRAAFYDASPTRVHLGFSPAEQRGRFPGTICLLERRTAEPALYTGETAGRAGVWRIELQIRHDLTNTGLPILASGVTGAGNLLVLMKRVDGRFELHLDQWGAGLSRSEPFDISEEMETIVMDVVVGSQVHARASNAGMPLELLEQLKGKMIVWIDNAHVWTVPIVLHHDSYDNVAIGSNAQGFSSALGVYPTRFKNVLLKPNEELQIVERALTVP